MIYKYVARITTIYTLTTLQATQTTSTPVKQKLCFHLHHCIFSQTQATLCGLWWHPHSASWCLPYLLPFFATPGHQDTSSVETFLKCFSNKNHEWNATAVRKYLGSFSEKTVAVDNCPCIGSMYGLFTYSWKMATYQGEMAAGKYSHPMGRIWVGETEAFFGRLLLMEEILHHLGCMKPYK